MSIVLDLTAALEVDVPRISYANASSSIFSIWRECSRGQPVSSTWDDSVLGVGTGDLRATVSGNIDGRLISLVGTTASSGLLQRRRIRSLSTESVNLFIKKSTSSNSKSISNVDVGDSKGLEIRACALIVDCTRAACFAIATTSTVFGCFFLFHSGKPVFSFPSCTIIAITIVDVVVDVDALLVLIVDIGAISADFGGLIAFPHACSCFAWFSSANVVCSIFRKSSRLALSIADTHCNTSLSIVSWNSLSSLLSPLHLVDTLLYSLVFLSHQSVRSNTAFPGELFTYHVLENSIGMFESI